MISRNPALPLVFKVLSANLSRRAAHTGKQPLSLLTVLPNDSHKPAWAEEWAKWVNLGGVPLPRVWSVSHLVECFLPHCCNPFVLYQEALFIFEISIIQLYHFLFTFWALFVRLFSCRFCVTQPNVHNKPGKLCLIMTALREEGGKG